MARFVFNLDALLRKYCVEEDEKRRALAEVLQKQQIVEDRIREIQSFIVSNKRDLGDQLQGRVEAWAIRNHAAMTMRLDSQARQLAVGLAQIFRQADSARHELLEASKRRKSLELLRERRYEEWRQTMNRREAAAMDDLNNAQYARRGVAS